MLFFRRPKTSSANLVHRSHELPFITKSLPSVKKTYDFESKPCMGRYMGESSLLREASIKLQTSTEEKIITDSSAHPKNINAPFLNTTPYQSSILPYIISRFTKCIHY